MRYLLLSQPSTAYAAAISALLYAASRPARQPEDQTAYYCGWVEHPATGAVALAMPEAGECDPLPIHPEADGAALASALAHALAPGEAEALAAAVEAARGTAVDTLAFVPASASTRLLTQAEAEAEGWFGGAG